MSWGSRVRRISFHCGESCVLHNFVVNAFNFSQIDGRRLLSSTAIPCIALTGSSKISIEGTMQHKRDLLIIMAPGLWNGINGRVAGWTLRPSAFPLCWSSMTMG